MIKQVVVLCKREGDQGKDEDHLGSLLIRGGKPEESDTEAQKHKRE